MREHRCTDYARCTEIAERDGSTLDCTECDDMDIKEVKDMPHNQRLEIPKKEEKPMPKSAGERKCKFCGETDPEKLIKNKKSAGGLENCCYECRRNQMKGRYVPARKRMTKDYIDPPLPGVPSIDLNLTGFLADYPGVIPALEAAAKDDIRSVPHEAMAIIIEALRDKKYIPAMTEEAA